MPVILAMVQTLNLMKCLLCGLSLFFVTVCVYKCVPFELVLYMFGGWEKSKERQSYVEKVYRKLVMNLLSCRRKKGAKKKLRAHQNFNFSKLERSRGQF